MTVKAVLAGSAGQGVPALGFLLAQAAFEAGKEVTCLSSLAQLLPGGPEDCTVAVSQEEIASPVASSPQIALALDEAGLARLVNQVAADGHLLINSSLVHSTVRRQDLRLLLLPAGQIAVKLGREQAAPLVMLGALAQATGMVSLKYLERALAAAEDQKPELELDLRALRAGAEQVRRAHS
ncbi:MAG: 2-oxoacid:ferredoxin oxidoreductase subunit gamma [Desulfarculus sp.]|jgi:2-oxoglutarate ferredoxin oxidoreductase subunit gamma|nr:MAG: 2-oxoacid:ferredoxin oxidoreductase subunit gamma [Desulfarculus sp.]